MDFIKNKKELSKTSERKDALDILEHGLASVHPHEILPRVLRYGEKLNSITILDQAYNLLTGRIFVVGAGKTAGAMAEALEGVLGAVNINAGIVLSGPGRYVTRTIEIVVLSDNNYQSRRAQKARDAMIKIKNKEKVSEKDLIICLLSDGAEPGFRDQMESHFAPARFVSLAMASTSTNENKDGHFVLSDLALALEAMAHRGRELGYKPLILGSDLEDDAGIMAGRVADAINSGEFSRYNALILGGHTDVNSYVSKSSGEWLFIGASPASGLAVIRDKNGVEKFEFDSSGIAAGELLLYITK